MTPNLLPAIPSADYPQRWAAVGAMMARQGLDLLIAYADDRAVFGPAHARWLANFPVHFEPCCVVLAPDAEPVLLCGPESDQYALTIGQLRDVRVLREFTHPDEDYPFSLIQPLTEVVRSLVPDQSAVRRVGLAGRGLMSFDLLAAFHAALPDVEWVDAESWMCDLRAVKSVAARMVVTPVAQIAHMWSLTATSTP